MFLQGNGKPGHGIVQVNIKNYCLGNSSVTHVVAKKKTIPLYIDGWVIKSDVAVYGPLNVTQYSNFSNYYYHYREK